MHSPSTPRDAAIGLTAAVLAGALAVCLCGCTSDDPAPLTLYERLQSDDALVRMKAIEEAADRKDADAVPLLVERLNDPETSVRFFAIVALDKITGRRMGYQVYAPQAQQDEAIQRWRDWLRKGRPEDWPRWPKYPPPGQGRPGAESQPASAPTTQPDVIEPRPTPAWQGGPPP